MHSYSLFDAEGFPPNGFHTNPQLEAMHSPQNTEVRRVGSLDVIGFSEYEVRHFTRVRFRGTPYYHQDPIDEVTERHTFAAFLKSDGSYLLMKYGKDVCIEASQRIAQMNSGVRISRPYLNLREFVGSFRGDLSGTYFRDIHVQNLRSGALFGPQVQESEFYAMFEQLGEVSAVIVTLEHDGEPQKVMVTSRYGIAFYKDLPSSAELAIIEEGLKPHLDHVRIAAPGDSEEGILPEDDESGI